MKTHDYTKNKWGHYAGPPEEDPHDGEAKDGRDDVVIAGARLAVLHQLGTKAEHLQAKKDYDAIHSHRNPHRP